MCVSNARILVSLIKDHHKADGTPALIAAWWYRVYYMHLAASVLIAAKLHPELSTNLEVLEAWEQVISILQAHAHFSPFIARSISSLGELSAKVRESQTVTSEDDSARVGGTTNYFNEDHLEDIGFDPSDLTLGLEDMQWMNTFTLPL